MNATIGAPRISLGRLVGSLVEAGSGAESAPGAGLAGAVSLSLPAGFGASSAVLVAMCCERAVLGDSLSVTGGSACAPAAPHEPRKSAKQPIRKVITLQRWRAGTARQRPSVNRQLPTRETPSFPPAIHAI